MEWLHFQIGFIDLTSVSYPGVFIIDRWDHPSPLFLTLFAKKDKKDIQCDRTKEQICQLIVSKIETPRGGCGGPQRGDRMAILKELFGNKIRQVNLDTS